MAPVQPFGDKLWVVEGPPVRDLGLLFSTRMTIARLADGSLWVNSPVPTAFDTLRSVTDLGPVRYLVAATPRHLWRLDAWHTLFPEAELWACPRSPLTLARGRLPLRGVLQDRPPAAWAADFDQVAFMGNPLAQEIAFFHKPSRTVILDDLIQNAPPRPGLLQNLLLRVEGITNGAGAVPLEIRLTFVNRSAARRSLAKLLAWDFDSLIIAHGACIERGARPFIQQAFRWLDR